MQIFILQSVGGFSSTGNVGGGVLGVVGTAAEWQRAGHDVHFITNEGDRGRDQYRGGVAVHRLPSLGLLRTPSPLGFLVEALLNPLAQRRALRRLMSSERRGAGVLLAISPFPADVITAFRLKSSLHLPAVVYFHHLTPPPWWHPFRRGNLVRSAASWALMVAALVCCKVGGLVPAFDQPQELSKAGWRFEEIMMDAHYLSPEEEGAIHERPRTYAACFIGRLAPNKGLPDLLRAWALVHERVPGARLGIAGEWYSERFQRQILRLTDQLRIQDSVSYLGFVATQEKLRLLDDSRAFVYPSYEEGWSLSVMEAAYRGLTPIVYDLVAYGYLPAEAVRVPVGDIEGLAEAMVRVLGESESTPRANSHLHRSMAQYTVERLAATQAKYLDHLVASQPTGGVP